ncbi:hypothetical protein JXD38_06540 [candidate division WOR-3 bacterium]|nr:hypothetical protein [candidate division WOR-3 bacterium]
MTLESGCNTYSTQLAKPGPCLLLSSLDWKKLSPTSDGHGLPALAVIPLILLFFAAQKQIIRSQARSGLKE